MNPLDEPYRRVANTAPGKAVWDYQRRQAMDSAYGVLYMSLMDGEELLHIAWIVRSE